MASLARVPLAVDVAESRLLVHRDAPCGGCPTSEREARELEARESAARWFLPALRPDTWPGPTAGDRPGEPPTRIRAPDSGPPRDRLWREFWLALLIVLLVAALAWAALALAGEPGGRTAARALGWPALVLPLGVVSVGLRGRGAGRADLAVAGLGLTLEASTVLSLHGVLGVLLGLG